MDKQHKLSDLEIVQRMVDQAVSGGWFTDSFLDLVIPSSEMTDQEMISRILECAGYYRGNYHELLTFWCGEQEEFNFENIDDLSRDELDSLFKRLVSSRIENLDPSGAVEYYQSKINAAFEVLDSRRAPGSTLDQVDLRVISEALMWRSVGQQKLMNEPNPDRHAWSEETEASIRTQAERELSDIRLAKRKIDAIKLLRRNELATIKLEKL